MISSISMFPLNLTSSSGQVIIWLDLARLFNSYCFALCAHQLVRCVLFPDLLLWTLVFPIPYRLRGLEPSDATEAFDLSIFRSHLFASTSSIVRIRQLRRTKSQYNTDTENSLGALHCAACLRRQHIQSNHSLSLHPQ